MTRRILIMILILVLLGAGAWFFFFRSSTPSNTAPQTLTNVLPFGNGDGTAPSGVNGLGSATSTPAAPSGAPTAHLFRLSDTAVAGAVAFVNKAGSLDVRYVERSTGHIYDIDPTSLAKTEIVNTTLPRVYDAIWRPDGSAVIMRTLAADGETIVSTSVTLVPPSSTSTSDLYTITNASLPDNISDIAAGGKDIFYTEKNAPEIVSALFDGSKAATIFSGTFSEWQLKAGDTSLMLIAKPSVLVPGYAYTLSSKGALSKLLGPLNGLSAISNVSLTRVAYSYSTTGGTALEAVRLSDGATTDLVPATLADKCVWSQKNASVLYCGVPANGIGSAEPDSWYRGISRYSDEIWQFDTDTNYAGAIVDPKKDFNTDIDVEKPFLSPNDDYLFFMNRNDLSLWALKLD